MVPTNPRFSRWEVNGPCLALAGAGESFLGLSFCSPSWKAVIDLSAVLTIVAALPAATAAGILLNLSILALTVSHLKLNFLVLYFRQTLKVAITQRSV